jgi:hypothetical protein
LLQVTDKLFGKEEIVGYKLEKGRFVQEVNFNGEINL